MDIEGPICLISTNYSHIHAFNQEDILSTLQHSKLGINNKVPTNNINTVNVNTNTDFICTTFCDRDFLLNDDEPSETNRNQVKCPEIKIKLGEIETKALLDSGASISCLSEQFFANNEKKLKDLEVFPLSNVNIRTATGQRSKQLKKIIFTEININNIKYSVQFVIVPNLIHDVIIGVDILKQIRAWMNFSNETIIVFNDKVVSRCGDFIKFVQKALVLGHNNNDDINIDNNNKPMCQCKEKHFACVKYENATKNDNYNITVEEVNNVNNYEYFEAPETEINEQIHDIVDKIESLNNNQKGQLDNLLKQYRTLHNL